MGSGWVHNAPPEVNAISRYPTILAVCISLTAVMTAIIAVRGYVRAVMLKSIGADDWTILFSGVSGVRLERRAAWERVYLQCLYCAWLSFTPRRTLHVAGKGRRGEKGSADLT